MVQSNTQTDPIIQILRLAYRRGLALQQEQAKGQHFKEYKSKTVNVQPLAGETLTVKRKTSTDVESQPYHSS